MALDVAQPAADLFVLIACLLVKGENLPCVCLGQADFGAWNSSTGKIPYFIILLYFYIIIFILGVSSPLENSWLRTSRSGRTLVLNSCIEGLGVQAGCQQEIFRWQDPGKKSCWRKLLAEIWPNVLQSGCFEWALCLFLCNLWAFIEKMDS